MKLTEEQLHEILVEKEFLTEEQFQNTLDEAEQTKKSVEELLIGKGLVSDEHLGALMAYHLKVPFIYLQKISIDQQALNTIPVTMAQKQNAIVFSVTPTEVSLALNDVNNVELIHTVKKKTGKEVNVFFATKKDIEQAIRLYNIGIDKELHSIISKVQEGDDIEEEDAIVQTVDIILRYAYEGRASDIHIEPVEDLVLVRYRIDGILHDVGNIPLQYHEQIIMRIKILANLRTDEHRLAQDGKFIYNAANEDVDIRVSVVPITDGEKVVLRLLSEGAQQFSLDSLGLEEDQLAITQEAIRKPHGMILATGPTGSGKTTTLYAIIKLLNTRSVNISTIEDPVEYDIGGVNQIQVDVKTNLTFASGLRSIVRQDPDVIMVGEIRDEETADIAVNSAMTGHLVLSTLHTNDAATTLPRLLDMGIEPFLIASTVNVIVAQRLVRKICSQCVESAMISGELLGDVKKAFNLSQYITVDGPMDEVRFYKGKGCKICNNTGYMGRTGIFEVMSITEEIKQLIMKKADASKIKTQAQKQGMTTMYEDGLKKALRGATTIEEVMRVIRE